MNSFAFEARSVVWARPEDELHMVGFADSDTDTRTYLMLQRAREFDEQDMVLGMDTYHVEWCGQERSGYGGIARFALRPGRVEIEFSQVAAEALGGLRHLVISFQLTLSERSALRGALGSIFENSNCLSLSDT